MRELLSLSFFVCVPVCQSLSLSSKNWSSEEAEKTDHFCSFSLSFSFLPIIVALIENDRRHVIILEKNSIQVVGMTVVITCMLSSSGFLVQTRIWRRPIGWSRLTRTRVARTDLCPISDYTLQTSSRLKPMAKSCGVTYKEYRQIDDHDCEIR